MTPTQTTAEISTVNGCKIRQPAVSAPEIGTMYFSPDVLALNYYAVYIYVGDLLDAMRLERGLVHLDMSSAVEHTKAMLGFQIEGFAQVNEVNNMIH